ncbi:hypothetical protein L484_026010 [Morus notabilis]|uniref:Uncharacterized protein n=1 Tax=Morus notabilis TaxID=981085 RepID=W9RWC6_9ROSA|nr:hypothetical protein L484_026010 [Morus notabilis]
MVATATQPQSSTNINSNVDDYTILDLARSPLYSDIDVSSYAPETLTEHSKSFSIDLGGPRVFFCADKAIDLIVKSGAGQYLEFKSIDASFVCDENGKLWNVPDSRGLTEKNQLMRIILYAIAMADYDQNDLETRKDVLKTKDGIDRLALYNKSVGRFPNATGALIYHIYGHEELSQAFCRRAALRLRLCSENANSFIAYGQGANRFMFIWDWDLLQESGRYMGVRLASGQNLFSDRLVLDPTFTVPSPRVHLRESLEGLGFVLYFSALCNDAKQGKNLLHAALNALLKISDSENAGSRSEVQNENGVKPTLLWSAMVNMDISAPLPCQMKHFSKMYPDGGFFPETTSPEDVEDDGELSLD